MKNLKYILILAMVVAISFYFFKKDAETLLLNEYVAETEGTTVPDEWPKENSEAKTFRSEKLGITFSYLTPYGYAYGSPGDFKMDSYNILVKEEGNKIYVDRDGQSPESSYPKIEVFYKDANIPLLKAATETFKDIDPDKCFVTATGGVYDVYSDNLYNSFFKRDRSPYPQGLYIYLSCSHKGNGEVDEGENLIMNADIPTKFIKVQTEQYIMTYDGTGENMWEDSIKIFK